MLLFRGNETAKKGYVCTIEKSHSQIEKRFYYQTDDISWLEAKVKWKDVKSIGMVEKIIEKDDEIRVERRYYITSLQTDATLFAKAVFCASRKCREMQRKVQRLDYLLNLDFSISRR